jgi:hypothetical protein
MPLVFWLLFLVIHWYMFNRLEHTSKNLCMVILDARTPGNIVFIIYLAFFVTSQILTVRYTNLFMEKIYNRMFSPHQSFWYKDWTHDLVLQLYYIPE